ncbi:PepSY domain-containing protein [Vagococcus sp. DIV0080]|uniref:PepSY domain-containing protein n=1 Tax=Candidatus Vagococcus giribetii TaxID=2230876 RepID=A0ABS3HSD5_9ENTE|nr:PepSY domain-containing protein [Vagococcus sp. DIV0080]MBO0476640.1 PepSY domain-containing protein [Vagococcus sp. DIV0080]
MTNSKSKEFYQHGLTTGIGIGLTVGAIGGAALLHFYKKNKALSADDILEKVKADFLLEGPIEGSWIHFKKEPLQKFAVHSKTYTGGISRIEDGELVQYEFVADAYTGTIIDIYRLQS